MKVMKTDSSSRSCMPVQFHPVQFKFTHQLWFLNSKSHPNLHKQRLFECIFLLPDPCTVLLQCCVWVLFYGFSLCFQALSVWISCMQVFLMWVFPSTCSPRGEAWAATSNWQVLQALSSVSLWRAFALTLVTASMMPSPCMTLCFPWEAWFWTGRVECFIIICL